jgi:hypothetical protein
MSRVFKARAATPYLVKANEVHDAQLLLDS